MKEVLHSSAVAFTTEAGAAGLLIVGKSGAGKSELALELTSLGAQLIADDQTELRKDGERVRLYPPAPLRGMIELRGLGILRIKHVEGVSLVVVVDLDTPETKRLPEYHSVTLLEQNFPCLRSCNSRVFAIGLKHYVLSGQWLHKEACHGHPDA